ncbi:MAG: DUF814 domain-containing protein [Gemmatimonadetes bacterium]|nr:DUF814 domain-containing protein [Gemmatimonadota bacterium]
MSIRWDPVFTRHLAAELNQALQGSRVRALRLVGGSGDLAILFEDRTLLWALHPSKGWLRLAGRASPAPGDIPLRGRVLAVESPPDERIVRMPLAVTGRVPTALVMELMGNQWNALVVEGEPGVIRHVLVWREGARPRRVGESYAAPAPQPRAGLRGDVSVEEWTQTLAEVPEHARAQALVRAFAWTSTLNATALLGAPTVAHGPSGLAVGHVRWLGIASGTTPPEPVLLELDTGLQPYPFPLAGVPCRRVESLLGALEACEAAAEGREAAAGAPPPDPALLDQLRGALRRAEGRATKLESELAALEDPAALRGIGDLILARYADIPPGASRARLPGFGGESVEVDLDPALAPHANAAAYYQRATKSERAAERLPALVEQARVTCKRIASLFERAQTGEADDAEIRAAIGVRAGAARADTPREARPSLPYRVFRSSGGLEIRVGRGARHNDDLTFHHSSPGDVWLHARHVGGAHVILRWPSAGNPPARDLAEAAGLAALHSKARTSSSVPVDWTFRKYVRKPRKSPPGRVLADRIETLFVTPDARLLDALAAQSVEPTSDPSPS